MLTVLVSGKAAPGATTAAWAFALTWPRPILAVDADAGGGDMAAGLLAGRIAVDRGLLSWSAATRRASTADAVSALPHHAVTLPEADQVWFLAGLHNPEQASSLDAGGWDRATDALESLSVIHGRDVIVDAGRLAARSCWPLLKRADTILLTCGCTVRSVHAARNAAAMLRTRLGDLARVALLVVGTGPFTAKEISGELQLNIGGSLPHDRDAAAVLTEGATVPLRGLRRSPLLRRAATIAGHIASNPAPRDGVPSDAVRSEVGFVPNGAAS